MARVTLWNVMTGDRHSDTLPLEEITDIHHTRSNSIHVGAPRDGFDASGPGTDAPEHSVVLWVHVRWHVGRVGLSDGSPVHDAHVNNCTVSHHTMLNRKVGQSN